METEKMKEEIKDLKKHINWLDRELRKSVNKIWDLEEKILDETDPWRRVGLCADYLNGYSFYVKH